MVLGGLRWLWGCCIVGGSFRVVLEWFYVVLEKLYGASGVVLRCYWGGSGVVLVVVIVSSYILQHGLSVCGRVLSPWCGKFGNLSKNTSSTRPQRINHD